VLAGSHLKVRPQPLAKPGLGQVPGPEYCGSGTFTRLKDQARGGGTASVLAGGGSGYGGEQDIHPTTGTHL
jgi:hypothetical protein